MKFNTPGVRATRKSAKPHAAMQPVPRLYCS